MGQGSLSNEILALQRVEINWQRRDQSGKALTHLRVCINCADNTATACEKRGAPGTDSAAPRARRSHRWRGGSMERRRRGWACDVTDLALGPNTCCVTKQQCNPERGFLPGAVSPSVNGGSGSTSWQSCWRTKDEDSQSGSGHRAWHVLRQTRTGLMLSALGHRPGWNRRFGKVSVRVNTK